MTNQSEVGRVQVTQNNNGAYIPPMCIIFENASFKRDGSLQITRDGKLIAEFNDFSFVTVETETK